MTKTERRKQIRRLQARADHCERCGEIKKNNSIAAEAAKSFADFDEAHDIRWALGYVERHVNLATGELTVALEDEQAA